jgi:hypothetical protein
MHAINSRRLVRHTAYWIVALGIIATAGCTSFKIAPSPNAEQKNAIKDSVRTFVATVADDVTKQGPAAWRTHFADNSAFFMAAEGHLVFANNDEATRGIQKLTNTIAHLELRWGEPLLVDPLTSTLVMVGMPYYEVRIDTAGQRVDELGYFTGLAELGSAGWKFRNAHWSIVAPPPPVP